MENEIFRAGNYTAKVVRCNTAIVGSGAAGFNAADRLWQLGQHDIVLVTETARAAPAATPAATSRPTTS